VCARHHLTALMFYIFRLLFLVFTLLFPLFKFIFTKLCLFLREFKLQEGNIVLFSKAVFQNSQKRKYSNSC